LLHPHFDDLDMIVRPDYLTQDLTTFAERQVGHSDSFGELMIHCSSTEEMADFNRWLGEQPQRHKIVVAGNHDLLFESCPFEARGRLTNGIYLENGGIVLESFSFWGCPVTPVFNDWAFNAERGASRFTEVMVGKKDQMILNL
jgi:hypothetical protein